MEPLRDRLTRLARQAIEDPSRASECARAALVELDAEARRADIAPNGYTYAGAHTFIARVDQLEVEPLPASPDGPPGVPIWTTANQPEQIRIPFDCWIYGVASWSFLPIGSEQDSVFITPTCADGRDLFAIDWGLDAFESFVTDGERRMIAPASVVTGTRTRPRMLSWKVQRNQQINVRFRSLLNAHVPTLPTPVTVYPKIAIAAVAFYAVNMEKP